MVGDNIPHHHSTSINKKKETSPSFSKSECLPLLRVNHHIGLVVFTLELVAGSGLGFNSFLEHK